MSLDQLDGIRKILWVSWEGKGLYDQFTVVESPVSEAFSLPDGLVSKSFL